MIQARSLTFHDLETHFGLRQAQDPAFFWEWEQDLPTLSDPEKQALDRVKSNLSIQARDRILLEDLVKMMVISPLLDLAGFYQDPFRIRTESSIQIEVEDQDNILIKGKIDVLVIQDQFWLLIVEAKRTELSVNVGLWQSLTYMWASRQSEQPIFGLVTNGIGFIFSKLVKSDPPLFSFSDELSVNKRDNHELYQVLSILKRIGSIMVIP